MDAEMSGLGDRARGVAGGEEQLRRHAADADAGGGPGAVIDQQRADAGGMSFPAGGEAGGTGTDHRDVDVFGAHGGAP